MNVFSSLSGIYPSLKKDLTAFSTAKAAQQSGTIPPRLPTPRPVPRVYTKHHIPSRHFFKQPLPMN